MYFSRCWVYGILNNLYTYSGNNPVGFKDPTGYKADEGSGVGDRTTVSTPPSSAGMPSNVPDPYKPGNTPANTPTPSYIPGKPSGPSGYSPAYGSLGYVPDPNLSAQDQALAELQFYLDHQQYDKIKQKNGTLFGTLPLFDGTIDSYGCGMLSALIALSKNGVQTNVKDAYNYFNQPDNEFFGTGAISPGSVANYLTDNGLNITDYDILIMEHATQNNSQYIVGYSWAAGGAHYQYIETDANGGLTAYSYPETATSFDAFMNDPSRAGFLVRFRIW